MEFWKISGDFIDDKYLYITTPYFIVDTNITEAIKNGAEAISTGKQELWYI